jgi:hypothetical protein
MTIVEQGAERELIRQQRTTFIVAWSSIAIKEA